jgi:hypothetical protein
MGFYEQGGQLVVLRWEGARKRMLGLNARSGQVHALAKQLICCMGNAPCLCLVSACFVTCPPSSHLPFSLFCSWPV